MRTLVSSSTAHMISVLAIAWRRLSRVSWWYSWDPWEKLNRATFIPAFSSFSSTGTSLDFGPRVQMILVFANGCGSDVSNSSMLTLAIPDSDWWWFCWWFRLNWCGLFSSCPFSVLWPFSRGLLEPSSSEGSTIDWAHQPWEKKNESTALKRNLRCGLLCIGSAHGLQRTETLPSSGVNPEVWFSPHTEASVPFSVTTCGNFEAWQRPHSVAASHPAQLSVAAMGDGTDGRGLASKRGWASNPWASWVLEAVRCLGSQVAQT